MEYTSAWKCLISTIKHYNIIVYGYDGTPIYIQNIARCVCVCVCGGGSVNRCIKRERQLKIKDHSCMQVNLTGHVNSVGKIDAVLIDP